ncbi:MAG: hypothetical protein R2911_23655 [Caldilineaceae bacterium]
MIGATSLERSHWPIRMNSIQPQTHSFVIKVWLEEDTRAAAWRGQITHVPSGRRQHFTALAEIPLLIAPFLEEPNRQLALHWRILRWLYSWYKA